MRDRSYLPPWVLQALGVVLVVGFAVFWAVTDRVEPLLIGLAGTLLTLGEASRAGNILRRGSSAKEENSS